MSKSEIVLLEALCRTLVQHLKLIDRSFSEKMELIRFSAPRATAGDYSAIVETVDVVERETAELIGEVRTILDDTAGSLHAARMEDA